MEKYSPEKLERSTRDVVSRSSYMEIMAGRGTKNGGVLIDATHMENVAKNFRGMVERCAEYGFDLVNSRVEVSPSAHYHMGGVKINRDCYCNIDGLFVSGEDSGGVHGANRLGGNGVADSIVFGARAGDAMAEYVNQAYTPKVSEAQVQDWCRRWIAPLERHQGENPFVLREQMEELMWKKAGVVRNGPDMEEAVPALQEMRKRAENLTGSGGTIFNAKWNEAINVTNLLTVAEMIARSALARTESRGAHYRQDFPNQSGDWLRNIHILPENGDMKFWTTDVEFTRMQPPPEMQKQAGSAKN